MDRKDVAGYVGAAVIGYVVLWEIGLFVNAILIGISMLAGSEPVIGMLDMFFYQWIILAGVGILVGVRSYRLKDRYYRAFKPDRRKVLYGSFIAAFFVVLPYISASVFTLNMYSTLQDPMSLVYISLLSLAIMTIIYYPFSAIATYMFRMGKRLRNRRHLIVLIILLNPVSVNIGLSVYGSTVADLTTEPCGVTFFGFTHDSAARDAGLEANDIIISINNDDVTTPGDMGPVLNTTDPTRPLLIRTRDGKVINLTMRYDEEEDRHMIGITFVQTAYCDKVLPG